MVGSVASQLLGGVMERKQNLLILQQLPPDLAKRLEGTDPHVIDAMEIQRTLLQRQTDIVGSGAEYIPTLAELFDQYFGEIPLTPTPLS